MNRLRRGLLDGHKATPPAFDSGGLWSPRGWSVANTRGYPSQDRWAAGFLPGLCWGVVADGITGGPDGAAAAQASVTVVGGVLTAATASAQVGCVDPERLLYRCFDTAQAAVAPWYLDSEAGGSTLTVALMSNSVLAIGCVGDSPAYASRHGEQLARLTPESGFGPLPTWIGTSDPITPWVGVWDAGEWERVALVTDGVVVHQDWVESPDAHLAKMFTRPASRGDDATAVLWDLTSTSVTTP